MLSLSVFVTFDGEIKTADTTVGTIVARCSVVFPGGRIGLRFSIQYIFRETADHTCNFPGQFLKPFGRLDAGPGSGIAVLLEFKRYDVALSGDSPVQMPVRNGI